MEQKVPESREEKRKNRSVDESMVTPENSAKRHKPTAFNPVAGKSDSQPRRLSNEVTKEHLTRKMRGGTLLWKTGRW